MAVEMRFILNILLQLKQIIRVKIGIVVGSHLGIGGLGITFFEE